MIQAIRSQSSVSVSGTFLLQSKPSRTAVHGHLILVQPEKV